MVIIEASYNQVFDWDGLGSLNSNNKWFWIAMITTKQDELSATKEVVRLAESWVPTIIMAYFFWISS